MNKKDFFKERIDKIAKESFNAEQKEIAKKIIDNTNEEDLDAVWGLISQRVKTGFVFDEAPEINHNCVAYIKENEKLGVNLDKKDVLEHALIIGENYDALKNLIATYTDKQGKGMIDVIYIDPPYNIEKSKDDGNDYKEEVQSNTFIYRDKYTRDGWLNMMNERLKLARKLLSEKGFIFISIDDNEHAYLKVLCDNIFGEEKFLTTIAWEKRTKCQNTETAKKMLQPKIEYVLVYKNFEKRAEFNCHIVGEKDYPQSDESGKYRIEEIGQMSSNGMRGRNTMIFSILGIEPKNGFQWKIGKETADRYINRNDIIIKGNKVYRKIRPFDESVENIKPFWAFMGAEQFGTAESAKEELSCILGTKEHGFETVKPVAMIKELLFQSTKDDSIILDFFAGSSTTGQAVMELNEEYGGQRKFILCTNNENNIAINVTKERLIRVITGKGSKGEDFEWSYTKDKKNLANNSLRVFEIQKEELNITDIEKAEKVKKIAEENFGKLNSNYTLNSDMDIYSVLSSLTPYKDETEV